MTPTGRVIATTIWPIVLMVQFIRYALYDQPTHFLLWKANRPLHAFVYLAAAALVAITIRPTPVPWLNVKAYVVTSIAFTSAIADLLLDGSFRHTTGTASGWVVIGVGNLGLVMWRTAYPGIDGRA